MLPVLIYNSPALTFVVLFAIILGLCIVVGLILQEAVKEWNSEPDIEIRRKLGLEPE